MIAEKVKSLLPQDLQKISYIGEFPTDKDNCIAIVETGGPHDLYFSKGRMDTPYLKIAVRNKVYPDGYEIIKTIKDMFANYVDHQNFGMVLTGDILYFGRDDKRRNLFQLTFKIFSTIK
jgi:hypothetical protein